METPITGRSEVALMAMEDKVFLHCVLFVRTSDSMRDSSEQHVLYPG
jgi:hypothetical protein